MDKPTAVDAELWRLEEIEEEEFNRRLDRDEYIRESEGE